jgi:hypothetical protein
MANVKIKLDEVPEEEEPVKDEEPEVPVEDELEDEEDIVSVESLDPDEELWPGGPTAGDVTDWKEEYGDIYVTSITVDKHVIWRPLTRPEYNAHIERMEDLVDSGQLSPARANLYNEEAIAELCMLFPKYDRKEKKSGLAGTPSLIAQQVMEASGFTALEVRQL